MSKIIDFHSHILPGIDDGSASLKMSLSMLAREAKQGIHEVVATPHFYANHDTPEAFLARREEAYHVLTEATAGKEGVPTLHLGAEVAFFRGMSESNALESLKIGKTRYILVELPMGTWYNSIWEELCAIREKQGLIPIIAHVDRYLAPLQVERLMRELEELPVLLQANIGFFLRRNTARLALKLLKQGRIHLLGSDCHNLESRPPRLGEGIAEIEKKLGMDALDLVLDYQQRVFVEC